MRGGLFFMVEELREVVVKLYEIGEKFLFFFRLERGGSFLIFCWMGLFWMLLRAGGGL